MVEATPEMLALAREDAERCARESGWPDEMYFGLLNEALRSYAHLKESAHDA